MEKRKFDVFVIGSGVAGRSVAVACAKKGLSTAIADNREFGGVCANRGCDPKKVILGPTEVLEMAAGLKGKGIDKLPKLNWKALQKFKATFTDYIPSAVEDKLKGLNITLFHQSPKFIDKNTLVVEGKTICADKIVIATGRVPRTLSFSGTELLRNSDDFLHLKKLPKSIVFIGAGYIGMEFAHIAARCGSDVTVIEHGDTALKNFDTDLVNELITYSKTLGIRFIFNAEINKLIKHKKNCELFYSNNKKKHSVKARLVINTAGRVPAVEALNLDKADIAFSEDGITCNEFMQSITNGSVYACGDVSSHSLPLTPLSGIEAKVVGKNIINGNSEKIDIPLVPSAVFTLPNLASVGYQENAAKSRYKNVTVNYAVVPDWYNAKRINARLYAYKIFINSRTKKIVGAHLLGPHAAETVNLFTLAMQNEMTTDEVKRMIFTYPSWGNDIKIMMKSNE